MPQEISPNPMLLNTPSKNSRGLKGLANGATEEFIDDRELAQRKAEAAGTLSLLLHTPNLNSQNYAQKGPTKSFCFVYSILFFQSMITRKKEKHIFFKIE